MDDAKSTWNAEAPNRGVARALFRGWWAVLLRGAVAVVLGLIALVWPQSTALAFLLLFGIYSVLEGALTAGLGVLSAVRKQPWVSFVAEGVFGVAVGVAALLRPEMALFAFVFAVGLLSVIRGLFQLTAAVAFRRELQREWLLGVAGGLSILFGFLVVVQPVVGVVGVTWLFGIYALAFGLTLTMLAFRLRRYAAPA